VSQFPESQFNEPSGDGTEKLKPEAMRSNKSMHEHEPKQITRQKAIGWCALLGFAGAHRFYLGQTGMGLLYFIFFWTCIPLFASFIDLIAFLSQDDEEFLEELREDPSYCHRSLVLQKSANNLDSAFRSKYEKGAKLTG
jgi:hypothetical protein